MVDEDFEYSFNSWYIYDEMEMSPKIAIEVWNKAVEKTTALFTQNMADNLTEYHKNRLEKIKPYI